MKKLLLVCVAIVATLALYANNIQIQNVTLTGPDTSSKYVMVQFDLSWDNSWRVSTGPANWDAAWVFIKYRVKNDTTWHHATLHYADGTGTGDGHVPAAGATISSSNDNGNGGAYGVFIYHNTAMNQGHVSYPATQLRWDYGVNGVPTPDSVTDLRAYAIEMVYVNQGSFQVGDGGSGTASFFTYPDATKPYTISSEAAITVGPVDGQLYYNSGGLNIGDQGGPIPDSFPKGYHAFYVMKYEITQDQYTAFLNTLTSTQAATRFVSLGILGSSNAAAYRMNIQPSGSGGYFTTTPYIACNFLLYADLAAYLDWAALRPMTELEYEKACRGPLPAVPGEFAWGTTQLNSAQYTLTDAGAADEAIATNYNSLGNAVWYSTTPFLIGRATPVRAGIFAANPANTGRVTAGATYYGIMEMTGNVFEDVIMVGDPYSRAFDGLPGDGKVDADGNENQPGWPQPYTFTDPSGQIGGYRGGGMIDRDTHYYTVSDRSHGYNTSASSQPASPDGGGRGSRTAP